MHFTERSCELNQLFKRRCGVFLLKVISTHLPGGQLLLERLRKKVIQHSVPKQLKVTQLFKTGQFLC